MHALKLANATAFYAVRVNEPLGSEDLFTDSI